MTLVLSLFIKLTEATLAFVTKVQISGILLLFKGVYWDAKKWFVSPSKYEISLLAI